MYHLTIVCFNHPTTTDISTLSLHDALPICDSGARAALGEFRVLREKAVARVDGRSTRAHRRLEDPIAAQVAVLDRKSTRLNSSHRTISYAVFCLKKKNNRKEYTILLVYKID